MRRTELHYREDYTPGPYFPSVGYKGTQLSIERASKVFSFSRSHRFCNEMPSSNLIYRIGPGSYNTDQTNIEKTKRSVPVLVKPSRIAPFTPKGYRYEGKQLVYTGEQVTSIAHLSTAHSLYAEVNLHKPTSYYSPETLEVSWGCQEDYEVIRKLGRGKYSEVFQGVNLMNYSKVVIKILKPVRTFKIQREVKILQNLQSSPNIPQLLDVVKDEGSKVPSLVMEYLENDDFNSLSASSLSDFEIRYYIYELLKALDFTHSSGIMHRDVKPQNLMVNHKLRLLKLIDWGLADFYFPEMLYNVRVASRYFKGPELLVNNQMYDYSLDMWSLGAMLAGIVFKKSPFFHGSDNVDQLVKISRVLGTSALSEYLKKYKLEVPEDLEDMLGHYPRKPWSKFITNDNKDLANAEAIDFISKILKYDHADRLVPKEAMEHEYFHPVKEMWSSIESGRSIKANSSAYETAKIIMSRDN